MRPYRILPIVAAVSAVLVLGACSGGGGGGKKSTPAPTAPPTVTITGLRVAGSTSEIATVTVKGVADDDGVADAAFHVAFALDGGSGSRSLPVDPGPAAAASDIPLTIVATDGSSNVHSKALVVTVNP